MEGWATKRFLCLGGGCRSSSSKYALLLFFFSEGLVTYGNELARLGQRNHGNTYYTPKGVRIRTISSSPLKPIFCYFNASLWYAPPPPLVLNQPPTNPKAGRNFDLSSRLPIILMMMAVAVTFSSALPVLFPMVTVYLISTYFGDKFHLLRVCRMPPQVRKPTLPASFGLVCREEK